ncbi:MAG: HAMP domain-containing sensor histidine kinase [Flavobacteriaceae bacterium]|nr:HAMP domain-containing sensor histidine kinase [Flavobacteriaceae bacterium]
MILLVIMSSVLIFFATLFQYSKQSEEYNLRRLERKENQVKNHLNYILLKNNEKEKILNITDQKLKGFFSISKIHKVEFSIFDIKGNPIFFSYVDPDIINDNYILPDLILNELKFSNDKRIISQNKEEKGKFQSSYSYLIDNNGNEFAILFFPYFEDISFSAAELDSFLNTLYKIYFFMLCFAILVAFFISKYVTYPLQKISEKIDQTKSLQSNKKIHLTQGSKEIVSLVKSYNRMVDALENNIEKLAKSEREQAWQEMAKQVAHEIKNPLTPMRLSIQSFQKNYNSKDKGNNGKINEFSKILLEQIDTMSSVANSFSDFATMPSTKRELFDIIEITALAIDIFEKNIITFFHPKKPLKLLIDRTQWIRVMTNLIQNALQSIPQNRIPKIKVNIKENKYNIKVIVSDNGTGIDVNDKNKIFEPKFTTKTGGMGLGLGIVKNILESLGGKIKFESNERSGTDFVITLKK